MNTTAIIIICIAFFLFSGVIFSFCVAYQIFKNTLYRSSKTIRTRACSGDSIEEQKQVFEEGIKWAENYKDLIDELSIKNDGLNLFGEYINLKHDKCAIIIQGRTESLLYSYYYADVYAKNGYNILTIDTRAHGLSDGKYLTAGIKEHKDLILWIDLIKERYSINDFVIHGVCIGAATAVYAYCATKDTAIKKIVSDGLFTSYYEIFKNHIIERKRPVWFFIYLTFFYSYLLDGVNILKKTPYKHMNELDLPILFIWSKKDIYCTMDKSKELFGACASKNKKLKFFPEGRHSFVRFCNKQGYDKVIDEFLKTTYDSKTLTLQGANSNE
jgi:hypothetical protein